MSDLKITVRNSGPGSHNRSGFASTCEAAELPPPRPKA